MKYIKGDLFENLQEYDFILHQCNLTAGMGAGFAKRITEYFSDFKIAKKEKEFINDIGLTKLGDYRVYELNWNTVVNLYSQYNTGKCRDSGVDTFENRIEWLEIALNKFANHYKVGRVKMPLIASDLAADTNRKKGLTSLEYFQKYIAPVVERTLGTFDVEVFYLEDK